jgi:U4/U6 small nuclear ribonucleoprotein PRP4
VAFHPSGDYVASASFDTTWRLWDVNTAKELLLQEGHSKEVYSVEFQNDGALVASGGLDAIGRIWDLRTGKTAMVLDGHIQAIFATAFSPNGYQVATGAGDDTIRIWDMRAIKSIYTIPAHVSNVSDIRFFHANDIYFKHVPFDVTMSGTDESEIKRDAPEKEYATTRAEWQYRSGLFFASAGYDGFVKLWSADDWQLLKRLSTDAGKVMSVDISSDGGMLVSGTYNRNFQLFAPEDA